MDISDELATLLAALRREGRARSGLDPRLVPADPAAAYLVAARVADALGWKVGGWKIAAFKDEMQRALRTTAPIYGRVFAQFVRPSPAAFETAKLLRPLPEVEYAVRLGADLPPRARSYSQDEVAEAVASIHPGLEVAECRFTQDAAFPPLEAILADGSGSGTIVHGPAIDDWRRRDIAGQVVTLTVNGVERRRGSAGAAIDHPLVPLTWLANELSRTGIGMKAGEIVSTGTLTGMIVARAGETHVADFGAFGRIQATFAP
ncbi:MAG: fumarylacetoacetate hydrolase family protein [Rhodospirillales bacterium]|nr:fumarylacetoacetate hydrolase family protein [Rhodospirillales bacterium]